MSETVYEVGDLIEVEKKEIASSTRMRGIVQSIPYEGVTALIIAAQGYQPIIKYLEGLGFTITVIEKAKPPVVLPTEPGAYSGRTGSVYILDANGGWVDYSRWRGSKWVTGPVDYMPLTRLAPVAEVLGRVREELTGAGYAENGTAILTALRAGNQYGVTS